MGGVGRGVVWCGVDGIGNWEYDGMDGRGLSWGGGGGSCYEGLLFVVKAAFWVVYKGL